MTVKEDHPLDKTIPQMSEARRYQQLRAHLSYLKLGDAADALPRILDAAHGWTAQNALPVDGRGK
jgi:hypothetical protein